MNEATFVEQLKRLTPAEWEAVVEGQGVIIVDDLRVEIGPANAPNTVIIAAPGEASDAEVLKRESLSAAAELLHNYYLTHPLSLPGFNQQAEALIHEHGATAFAAVAGQFPRCTLFVDGGEVVAESAESPRHRYGVYCELERPLDAAALEGRVRQWLQRGEAHERYLEMNVCRYTC